MKKTHLLFTTLAAVATIGVFSLTGCSGDDTTGEQTTDSGTPTDSGGGGDSGKTDGGNPNAPPTLGTEIDRMGRPAINTALNHTFDIDPTAKGNAKDAYNQDQGVSGWQAAYTPQFAGNLAVLDSLDNSDDLGNGCGNQFGFALTHTYTALAGVLADDRVYVDTSQTTCSGTAGYLSVEIAALLSTPGNDCGGRTPNADVIARTYAAASGASSFDDGVTAASSPAGTTFPYLADPH